MLTKIAPHIYRKRLLIEGFFTTECTEKELTDFFPTLTSGLSLKTYGAPIVHSTSGVGKDENQGYDAFVPLIDSGIYISVWLKYRFLSMVLYTCKDFDDAMAVEITKDFFAMSEMESAAF